MDYKKIAQEIIDNVGGGQNIIFTNHCSTRLRLELVDVNKVNVEQVEKISVVSGTTYKANQFQIIIGTEVMPIYKEIEKMISGNKEAKVEDKVSLGGKILDVITGSLTPVIPLITGSGLIAAFLALFSTLGWIDTGGHNYYILNTLGNVGLYFLPVFLGYSIARKIDASPYYGALIGALMLHPSISALGELGVSSITYFGLPMKIVSYGSSMVPIFLAVFFLKYVEKFLNKIIPNIMKILAVPPLIFLIVGSATLLLFGPIGVIVGDLLAKGIFAINDSVGFLAVGITAALLGWLTITGMHLSLLPIGFIGLATVGFDSLIFPAALAFNLAAGGAGLAVALKTKHKTIKSLALTNTFTVIMGISEPILFSIHLKLKRPLFAVSIGAGIAGLFMGLMNVKAIAPGNSILSLPAFIGDTFVWAAVGAVIAFVVAFLATYLIGFDDDVFAKEME